MAGVKIFRSSNNIEIMGKLINSVAKKYDCGVRYNPHTKGLHFFGDSGLKRLILAETLAIFGLK